MDMYKYLTTRAYPVRQLVLGQSKDAIIVVQCKEWYGPEGFDSMLHLVNTLKSDGYTVGYGPVPGSWAEAHWEQLCEHFGIQLDDLPW